MSWNFVYICSQYTTHLHIQWLSLAITFFYRKKIFFSQTIFFSSSLSLWVNGKNEKWHRGVKVNKMFVVYINQLWGAGPKWTKKGKIGYLLRELTSMWVSTSWKESLKTLFKHIYAYDKFKHIYAYDKCLSHIIS